MQSSQSLDSGKPVDWGRTSKDYNAYRPGYPQSFYDILSAIGIGRPDQRILDIATGPGVLAIPLALTGAAVTGVDIADNQIAEARELATAAGATVEFIVADAEDTGLPSASFNVITASMCMHYFKPQTIIPEIQRMLLESGKFLVASLIYLPRESPIAAATERLIKQYNPKWGGADFGGSVPAEPEWAHGQLRLQTFHHYTEGVRFTRESWRGRIRACRGVGASLNPDATTSFDRDHQRLLDDLTQDEFFIPHLIAIHVFRRL
jgi:SAM-dependent methyltransferase